MLMQRDFAKSFVMTNFGCCAAGNEQTFERGELDRIMKSGFKPDEEIRLTLQTIVHRRKT